MGKVASLYTENEAILHQHECMIPNEHILPI